VSSGLNNICHISIADVYTNELLKHAVNIANKIRFDSNPKDVIIRLGIIAKSKLKMANRNGSDNIIEELYFGKYISSS
jgi:hypothetical protein